MVNRIWTLVKHWRAAKTALSTLSFLYGGRDDLDALGGLTEEEIKGLVSWLPEQGTFVEVGTLFGLTALAIKRARPELRVIAVDNFSWNPFGLPPAIHENFTRQILAGSGVEIVRTSSTEWRKSAHDVDAVFFDASHRYEDVLEECQWARAAGIRLVSGHDYNNANPRFGVTRAVDEVFGRENVVTAGMCWRIK